jgi:hypothetical protein
MRWPHVLITRYRSYPSDGWSDPISGRNVAQGGAVMNQLETGEAPEAVRCRSDLQKELAEVLRQRAAISAVLRGRAALAGRMSHTPAALVTTHLIHDFGTIVGGTPVRILRHGEELKFSAAGMRCQAWPVLTIHSSSRLALRIHWRRPQRAGCRRPARWRSSADPRFRYATVWR